MSSYDRDTLLAPMRSTGGKYWGALAATILALLVFGYFYTQMLMEGHYLTGMDSQAEGGVPWGLDIGAFAWWVGIAHGGIAISAGTRLLKKDKYEPIARIAELLTIVSLIMAVTHIMFDLGAPDAVFQTVLNYPLSSPLIWDVTVITVYFLMSATYLVLSMRQDIANLRASGDLPGALAPLYSILTIGYSDAEEEKMDSMLWWMALGILALIGLLSGGVIPWLFNLQASQPGWFGAIQGPAFITSALASAIAAVVIVAAIFRFAYGWDDLIDDDIFAGLGVILALLSLSYLWVTLHEVVEGSFYGPAAVAEFEHMLTAGAFSTPYLLAVGGLVLATAYLCAQAIMRKSAVAGTVVASVIIVVAILAKKTVYVAGGLAHSNYALQPTGVYEPTVFEYANLLGTLALVALIYIVAVKVIPIVPVTNLESGDTAGSTEVES